MSRENDLVEITVKELISLKVDQKNLQMLEAGGVDNWEWCSESLYPDDGPTLDDEEDAIRKQYGLAPIH